MKSARKILFVLTAFVGGALAGKQCTDSRAESEVRYCEYGCCVDSASACCGFPTWILIVGFVGGAAVVGLVILAACCVAYKLQNAKLKRKTGPAGREDDRRVIHVTSPPMYPPPASARYSSAQTSEYSYCAHDLYEPGYRQTFWEPDKDLNLYTSTCTSDSESFTGGNVHDAGGYVNKPDDAFSDRTNRSKK